MSAELKKICVPDGPPQNPVVIARFALTNLARNALPPTPENYTREYRRAAGQPDSGEAESHADELAAESANMLLRLVETVGETTTGLAVGIERFDGDLKTLFGEVDQVGPEGVRGLLEGLIASGVAVQRTVESSRSELDATRTRLDQVTAELERSRAQARIDPLTGAVNRRGMEEIVSREIARARRNKTPVSVAILDIDHFKRINDQHGHDIGDKALIHLVATAKSRLRETDVLCRYGGEEFVIILPDTGVQRAFFVIDRLRMTIEETPLKLDSGDLQICFSAGVAELSADDDQVTIVKRADAALYAAKHAGRNRVLVARAATA